MSHPQLPIAEYPSSLLQQRDSFLLRAKALFWGRIAIDSFYLLLWFFSFIDNTIPFHRSDSIFLAIVIGYLSALTSLYFRNHQKLTSIIHIITLMIDGIIHIYLTQSSGYLLSPLMAFHPFLTAMFVILFNSPVIIALPLLNLPALIILSLIYDIESSIVTILGAVILYCILDALTIFFIYFIHGQEQHLSHSLLSREQELKKLLLLNERQRIGREFHDGVGAHLTSIVMQCDSIKVNNSSPELIKDINEIQYAAHESIDDMRRSIAFLNDNFDVADQVFIMSQNIKNRHKIEVHISDIDILTNLSIQQQLHVCRIIQEALSNAIKHSSCNRIDLKGRIMNGHHCITIKDNGIGFKLDTEMSHHYGLLNMKYRAQQIGAVVEIDSVLRQGTSITLKLHPNYFSTN